MIPTMTFQYCVVVTWRAVSVPQYTSFIRVRSVHWEPRNLCNNKILLEKAS